MNNTVTLKFEIKRMLVKNLMLQITAEEIGHEQLLFGLGNLGLDSVDALQLVVAMDKDYGLKISDRETARGVLKSVDSMASALQRHLTANSKEARAE